MQNVYDVENFWRSTITEEQLPDHLKDLVRADLEKAWYYARIENFHKAMKMKWATVDTERVVLGDTVNILDHGCLTDYLCNKPTALYWLQSAQRTNGLGQTLIHHPSSLQRSTKNGSAVKMRRT